MDIKNVIERINFLYHKSRGEELSAEEKCEQTELRRYYIDLVKNNLKAQLDTIDAPKSKRS
ncbi:MAG: DUF896 domain-containing protein [Solirubrobacterales bacterium]